LHFLWKLGSFLNLPGKYLMALSCSQLHIQSNEALCIQPHNIRRCQRATAILSRKFLHAPSHQATRLIWAALEAFRKVEILPKNPPRKTLRFLFLLLSVVTTCQSYKSSTLLTLSVMMKLPHTRHLSCRHWRFLLQRTHA